MLLPSSTRIAPAQKTTSVHELLGPSLSSLRLWRFPIVYKGPGAHPPKPLDASHCHFLLIRDPPKFPTDLSAQFFFWVQNTRSLVSHDWLSTQFSLRRNPMATQGSRECSLALSRSESRIRVIETIFPRSFLFCFCFCFLTRNFLSLIFHAFLLRISRMLEVACLTVWINSAHTTVRPRSRKGYATGPTGPVFTIISMIPFRLNSLTPGVRLENRSL